MPVRCRIVVPAQRERRERVYEGELDRVPVAGEAITTALEVLVIVRVTWNLVTSSAALQAEPLRSVSACLEVVGDEWSRWCSSTERRQCRCANCTAWRAATWP